MTKITFYLLNSNDPSAEHFACRLVDKAWRQGLSSHIHTTDASSCQEMDALLWGFQEERFLPHAVLTARDSSSMTDVIRASPITLGFDNPELQQKPLLINLDAGVPDFFRDFSRVCEIVVDHPDLKATAREKYRIYKQTGLTPETHHMT